MYTNKQTLRVKMCRWVNDMGASCIQPPLRPSHHNVCQLLPPYSVHSNDNIFFKIETLSIYFRVQAILSLIAAVSIRITLGNFIEFDYIDISPYLILMKMPTYLTYVIFVRNLFSHLMHDYRLRL